jgi:hypothetical protein
MKFKKINKVTTQNPKIVHKTLTLSTLSKFLNQSQNISQNGKHSINSQKIKK